MQNEENLLALDLYAKSWHVHILFGVFHHLKKG
jgi:hypothetical protein